MTAARVLAEPELPEAVDTLVQVIRDHLTDDLLRAEWLERRLQDGRPTTGHCVAAASAFWWLAGGREAGWRQRNLPVRLWARGPHYFVEHESGLIVDPTADQFDDPVPYERAEGRGPPTSGGPIPKSARVLAARVQGDPRGLEAVEAARQWAFEHTTERHDPTAQRVDAVLDGWAIPAAVAGFVVFDDTDAGVTGPQVVTAASAVDGPADEQKPRAVDAVVRKFLGKIRATEIHCRRVGYVTYSWDHQQDVEFGDTSSQVRWWIRVMGAQIHMACQDIQTFSRILQKPFTVRGLEDAYRAILRDMDADAET